MRPAMMWRSLVVFLCLTMGVCAGWAPVCRAEDGTGRQEQGGSISPEAQQAMKLLDAGDPYLQQMGFLRLEALREPATAAVIRRYLASKQADTRAFSVRALAAIEGAPAIPALIERLKEDRSPRVRVATILALEPLTDPTVMPALIEKLRDRNAEVRMAAVDVVSRIDQPQAREAIRIRWRRERHHDVRRVLQDAAKRIGLQ